jgi:hypothetical protein
MRHGAAVALAGPARRLQRPLPVPRGRRAGWTLPTGCRPRRSAPFCNVTGAGWPGRLVLNHRVRRRGFGSVHPPLNLRLLRGSSGNRGGHRIPGSLHVRPVAGQRGVTAARPMPGHRRPHDATEPATSACQRPWGRLASRPRLTGCACRWRPCGHLLVDAALRVTSAAWARAACDPCAGTPLSPNSRRRGYEFQHQSEWSTCRVRS